MPVAEVLGTRSCVLYAGGESVAVNEMPALLPGKMVAGVQYGISITFVFAVTPVRLSSEVSTVSVLLPFHVTVKV